MSVCMCMRVYAYVHACISTCFANKRHLLTPCNSLFSQATWMLRHTLICGNYHDLHSLALHRGNYNGPQCNLAKICIHS